MKKLLVLILVILCAFGCVSCGKEPIPPAVDVKEEEYVEEDSTIDISLLMPVAIFTMDSGETFEVELYKRVAPITVANFLKLAKSGFYNGTIIHRITFSGIYVIQGGGEFLNQDNQQYSKGADTIVGEFTNNGIPNNLSHEEGVISMARTLTSYDSASSQFFICYADSSALDGEYATFGRIRKGIDVVKNISKVPCSNETPNDYVVIKSVTIKYVQI